MYLDHVFRKVILARFGKITFLTYGILYGLAGFIFFELLFLWFAASNHPIDQKHALSLTIYLTIGIILLSKLLYWAYNIKRLFRDPFSVINEAGFVFYGGLMGILVISIFVPFKGIHETALLDFTFITLPFMQILLRLGCASYGCCYGHPYDGPLAYTHKDSNAKSVRVMGTQKLHPTQFYSLIKDIFLSIAVVALFIRFPNHGFGFALWLILYPMMRFMVDFTRDHTSSNIPYIGGYRISQWLSALLFIVGIVSLFTYVKPHQYTFNSNMTDLLHYAAALLPITVVTGIVFALCYGVQGPILGYYCPPKNLKN